MSASSDQQRILDLEKRQADLEKRIADLEKQAARQVPWWPGGTTPNLPPLYPDNPLDPGYPGTPVWPRDLPRTPPWGSDDARCGTCGGLFKDMSHYVCTHPHCPGRVTFSASTPNHLKGTTVSGPTQGVAGPKASDLPRYEEDLPSIGP